ncbi:MAG: alpha-hydroxy-acid oxidizing protein [Hyphomicrobiales bacterium]|nr:MAG: alpha-hydroxy-acid oxidizing protein [Hyphomicrobiales bacterium]
MGQKKLITLDDYGDAARRRLPKVVYDVVAGGANDEITMRRNRDALRGIRLRPRALADVRVRDLRTSILGTEMSMPVMLAPCGVARMMRSSGELAVARAAGAVDVPYVLSTASSYEPEAVAEAATGPLWFQLYPPADEQACTTLVERAQRAGYSALCVTIDGAVLGQRERDRRNGLQIPLRPTASMIRDGMLHPRWAIDFLRGESRAMMSVSQASPRTAADAGSRIKATANPVTLETVKRIRDQWDGPLLIKGVMRGDEVDALVGVGAQGIIVSNHGGRQLDGVPATIEILPEVVAAARGRADVLIDGGFRRGTDVLKALALGAKGVLIGRPYLNALAVGGEAGVVRMLKLLRAELDAALALTGCASIHELDTTFVTSITEREQHDGY